MWHKILAGVTLILVAFAGCTKTANNTTARGTLQDYVTKAFAVKTPADLEELLSLSVDKAHDDLEALKKDDELFKKTFIDQKLTSSSSLKIRDERKVADDRYAITYELTYKSHTPASDVAAEPPVLDGSPETKTVTQPKGETDDTVTVKKLAVIVAEGGKWFISDVQNIKTFVEHTTDETISAPLKR